MKENLELLCSRKVLTFKITFEIFEINYSNIFAVKKEIFSIPYPKFDE